MAVWFPMYSTYYTLEANDTKSQTGAPPPTSLPASQPTTHSFRRISISLPHSYSSNTMSHLVPAIHKTCTLLPFFHIAFKYQLLYLVVFASQSHHLSSSLFIFFPNANAHGSSPTTSSTTFSRAFSAAFCRRQCEKAAMSTKRQRNVMTMARIPATGSIVWEVAGGVWARISGIWGGKMNMKSIG